jgi:hypothetical protein
MFESGELATALGVEQAEAEAGAASEPEVAGPAPMGIENRLS